MSHKDISNEHRSHTFTGNGRISHTFTGNEGISHTFTGNERMGNAGTGNRYAVLPCNGLDKCAGCITREVALLLSETTNSEIICPVFYRVADTHYNKLAQEMPLLVLDGCASRCASRLAAEKGLNISRKVTVTEEAKANGISLRPDLQLGKQERELVNQLAAQLTEVRETKEREYKSFFLESLDYDTYKKDKFVFRVPTNAGFYFNENDVWAFVYGNKAKIGVTDYVQKSLSDLIFFTPPDIGAEIEQFDEAGSLESGKAVFEIISPVGGTIISVNDRLSDEPELVNQNPYEQGWVAELELSDFEEDRELLHSFDEYFPIMKRKVDEFHV